VAWLVLNYTELNLDIGKKAASVNVFVLYCVEQKVSLPGYHALKTCLLLN
jgi:hypothetical protein